jgi:hypothetical protein
MKAIRNGIVILLFSFLFFACKKDKEKEYEPILRNGYYYFDITSTPSVPHGYTYYLYNDNFYPSSPFSDSVCYNNTAGKVHKSDSIISIPFLYYFDVKNICSFYNSPSHDNSFIFFLSTTNYNYNSFLPKFQGTYVMYDSVGINKIYWSGFFSIERLER